MQKVVLIGKMDFYYKMAEVEQSLIMNGYLPLLPTPCFGYIKGIYNKDNVYKKSTIEIDQLEKRLFDVHREKILLSDIVLICNFFDSIGESMYEEFLYAWKLKNMGMNKKIYFLQDTTGELDKEYLGSLPVYTCNDKK